MAIHHPRLYMDRGDFVIKVADSDVLYNIPVGTLTRESRTLRNLFAPSGKPVPTSDEHPFVLSKIDDFTVSKRDLERLLKFVYFGTANTFDTATECLSILTACNATDLIDTQDRCQYILESYDKPQPVKSVCSMHPFEPCDDQGAYKELQELGELDDDDDDTIVNGAASPRPGANPQSIGEQMNKYHRELQQKIKSLQGKLDTAWDTIEERDRQLAECQDALKELQAQYDSLSTAHKELQSKYEGLQQQLLTITRQLADTSAELIKCREECAKLQKQLTDEKAKSQDLANKNAALTNELDQQKAVVAQLQNQLSAANANASRLAQENAKLRNQLTTATKLADTYYNNYLQSEAKLSAVTRQRNELQQKLNALGHSGSGSGSGVPPGVPQGMTKRGVVIRGANNWRAFNGFFNTQTGDVVYSDGIPRPGTSASPIVNSTACWGYNTRSGETGFVSTNPWYTTWH